MYIYTYHRERYRLETGWGTKQDQCQQWFSAAHIANTLIRRLSPRHTPKIHSHRNITAYLQVQPIFVRIVLVLI